MFNDQNVFLNFGDWKFGYYLIIGAWNLVIHAQTNEHTKPLN